MQISKSKPQVLTDFIPNVFSEESEKDGRDEQDGSPNDEEIDIKDPHKNYIGIKATLGIHSTLINDGMELEPNTDQEEIINMFSKSGIVDNWRKIHWKVWDLRYDDQNLFFYYFPKFEDNLKVGSFSEEEEEILLSTLIQLYLSSNSPEKCKNRIRGKWGFISLKVPNRNGLLCYQHYLKMRLKKGEFKNLDSYFDFLKRKITNQDLLDKIEDTDFIDFFLDLSPGYSKPDDQTEFWKVHKEANRKLGTEDAIQKIDFINEYKNRHIVDDDQCKLQFQTSQLLDILVPTKDLQKENFEPLLVSISNHPYVKIVNEKQPSMNTTRSVKAIEKKPNKSKQKESPSKEGKISSNKKKDEGKSSTNSKTPVKKSKKLRVDSSQDEDDITTPGKSTDVSNIDHTAQKLTPNTIMEQELEEDFTTRANRLTKSLKNSETKKGVIPSFRETNEINKDLIAKLVSKYQFRFADKEEIESYDSEPEIKKKTNDILPFFFSDISSIESNNEQEESEFFKEFSLLKSRTDSRDTKQRSTQIINDENIGKRKHKQIMSATNLRDKPFNYTKRRRFMDEETPAKDIKERKQKKQRGQNEKRKKSRKPKNHKTQRKPARLMEQIKRAEKKESFRDEDDKSGMVKYTDKALYDYLEDDIANRKLQTKLSDYYKPKEMKPEYEEKRMKSALKTEHVMSELLEIYSCMERATEKQIIMPKYEVMTEFVEDEDRLIENYYACLMSLERHTKTYLACIDTYSMNLFGKFDAGFILQIRKASTLLSGVEKELHKISRFSSIKEGILKSTGEIGNRCLKLIQKFDDYLVQLMNMEGASLLGILAVADSGYKGTEEILIKETLAHILKLYKNLIAFMRKFEYNLPKASKGIKNFIDESLHLYIVIEIYFKKGMMTHLPLLEEFISALLHFNDEREVLLNKVFNEFYQKMQHFLKSLICPVSDLNMSVGSNESFLSISKRIKSHFSEPIISIMKKRNEIYEDPNDNPFFSYLMIVLLKYYFKMDMRLGDLLQDATFMSNVIGSKFSQVYLLISSEVRLAQHKILQYISRPLPDSKLSMLESIQEILLESINCANQETVLTQAIELSILLTKILPLKTNFFFKVYEATSKVLKLGTINLKNSTVSFDKICNYENITLGSYLKLTSEVKNNQITHVTSLVAQNNIIAFPLIFELAFENEACLDENEQIKNTRRIISKLLSLIPNYQTFTEENTQDPKQFKQFLMDFSILLALVNLSQNNPELLKSVYLKVTNFIGNIQSCQIIIKSLILSIHIDIMKFCIQYKDSAILAKEVFEKVIGVLSSLLSEFLEVSKFINLMQFEDNISNKSQTNLVEEKYFKQQRMIEQNLVKLRGVIINNIEFILENQVNLYPKGNITFLKMLNPKNPVTCGLRKEIMDYLDLLLMSRERVHDLLKEKKCPSAKASPSATFASQIEEEDVEYLNGVLERARKTEFLMNSIMSWRQTGLENGKQILEALYDLIMSIYNKDIMTKIHPKFHADIFLVEKALELYAIISKLLLIDGRITYDEIEQKFGITSLFYTSKVTKNLFSYTNEDRLKGVILSKNSKLGMLLRFYSKFFSFDKGENNKLVSKGVILGLESFVISAHLVLLLATMESLSNISTIQQNFYLHMGDFALLVASQDVKFATLGFKEFMLYAYLERGLSVDDSRDTIEIIRRICFNLEVAIHEIEQEEKSNLVKFIESLLIKLVRALRQDLFEESQSNNNGKFFQGIYKNISGLVIHLGKIFTLPNLNKSLIDLVSFVFIDAFGKINYNIADEFIPCYDPILINLVMKENLLLDFKPLIEAIFGIPHKDRHFPRKIFLKLMIFLLKKDLDILNKLRTEEYKKQKKWEILFRKDSDLGFYTETFLHNLFSFCDKNGHQETFLNTLREMINYAMLQTSDMDLILPFLKCMLGIIKTYELSNWVEKIYDILAKLMYLLDTTIYCDEERIAVLYLLTNIIKKCDIRPNDDKHFDNNKKLKNYAMKWILQILSDFDPSIMQDLSTSSIYSDKLTFEGFDLKDLNIKLHSNENGEINEMQVKIFEMSLRLYNYFEEKSNNSGRLAEILKDLIQEKMKINLTLGEGKMSGETKRILLILNEFQVNRN